MQVVSQYTWKVKTKKKWTKKKTKPGPVSKKNHADFVWLIMEISCTDAKHYNKTVTESEEYYFYVCFVKRWYN